MMIYIMLFGIQRVETCLGFFKKWGMYSEFLSETTVESKMLWGPAILFLPCGHFNFALPVSASHPLLLMAGPLCNLQARSQRRQRDHLC